MHQIGMHLSYQTTPLSEGVSQKITNTIALSNLNYFLWRLFRSWCNNDIDENDAYKWLCTTQHYQGPNMYVFVIDLNSSAFPLQICGSCLVHVMTSISPSYSFSLWTMWWSHSWKDSRVFINLRLHDIFMKLYCRNTFVYENDKYIISEMSSPHCALFVLTPVFISCARIPLTFFCRKPTIIW